MNKYLPLKKCLSYLTASLFLLLLIPSKSFSTARSATNSNTWNNIIWSPPGIVVAGDILTIPAGITVTVDQNTVSLGGLTIFGTVIIQNSPGATLNLGGNLTVNGTLDNQGNIDVQLANIAFTLANGATYIHNPRVPEEVIFENSTETFGTTSNLYIYKWMDEAMPLCASTPTYSISKINSATLGNVFIDIGPVIFDQDGLLSPHRIWGSLTINNTKMIFDDGTGMQSNLTLQDVTLTGTAIAVFQTGANRPFTLVTNNFTDNSTLTTDTSMLMYNSFGNLTWTVNGNLNLAHNFSMTCDTIPVVMTTTSNVTVNGNATFSNGAINFIKQNQSSLTMNVTGTTTIGAVSKFRMIDSYIGALSFTTNNLIISGGNDNVFMGMGDPSIPQVTGTATVNVTNDFSITAPSITCIMNADLSAAKARVTVGNDFIMSSPTADLKIANSNGAMTFKTTRDYTITGGNFTGQLLPTNISIDTLSIGRNFLFNSPTATNYLKVTCGGGNTALLTSGSFHLQNSGTALGQGVYGIYGDKSQTGSLTMTVGTQYSQDAGRFNGIYDGSGNMTFSSIAPQPFLMNGGDFRGIYNPDTTNAGNTVFTLNSMDFNGGTWMMHCGINTVSATSTITITSNCDINFGSATDQFMFVGLPYVAPANNTLLLTATIGGNLIIGGTTGTFVSSKSGGDETINITGNFDIGGGNNSFNIVQNSGFAFGHAVTLNLSGGLNVSGGTTFVSAEYGTATATISGNMTITGGIFSIKGSGGFAAHNFNVNGNFTQSAGTFNLHNNTLTATNAAVNVTFNSDFTQSGGTISFDNNASASSASHVINIKGANYNLLGTGVITSASPGTGTVLGQINFSRAGATNYNRSGTHDVQQAKQYVNTGTTLIINSGSLQVASTNNAAIADIFSVQFGGTLDMKTNQIYSNASQAYSILEVRSTGRVRTQNVNGLYNINGNAAINNAGNMNYNLSGGSVVEHYGVANQVLTGIGPGIATLVQHKYGILEINMAAGAYTHVSSGTDSVFIRSTLNLRAGELSLDDDHVSSNGGGRTVTIESPVTTAIISVPGSFIRSETEDGSARLKWKMGSITGIHKVPFAMTSTIADSLPVFYAPTAATLTGDVTFATYHTVASNLPFPPTVNQLNNAFTGANNSAQTVDRFWYIGVSGATPPVPNITFYCLPTEKTLSLTPGTLLKAQKWMFPMLSWSYPFPGASQTNPTVNSAQVVSSALQTGWWTLTNLNEPLPVEFLSFSSNCDDKNITLQWETASETNNDHFTVEKSRDGKTFEFLTIVKGAGNSSSYNKYKIVDPHPFNGICFYRLSQTDYDGRTEFFKTTTSQNCLIADENLHLVVAMNEESGTSLFVTVPASEEFTISVFDAAGNQVLTQKSLVKEGFNHVNLKTKNLSSGIYYVKLIGNSHVLSQRFFVPGNQ